MILPKFPRACIFFFVGIPSSACRGKWVQTRNLNHQEESQLFSPSLQSYNPLEVYGRVEREAAMELAWIMLN